jgi:hypothetical protein
MVDTPKESQFQMNPNEINDFIDNPKESGE